MGVLSMGLEMVRLDKRSSKSPLDRVQLRCTKDVLIVTVGTYERKRRRNPALCGARMG